MKIGDRVETKFPMEYRDQFLTMGHGGTVVGRCCSVTNLWWSGTKFWWIKFDGKAEAFRLAEPEVNLIRKGR